ncbi:MAG: DUF4339 domain-containing protein [Opitutaceae bacterium]|nr:DUF4339 domain-containing protein [Opitutaceae bacterium]
MFIILGADGKEYGPASIHQIRSWMEGGRANLQTRARRAEETDWKTLGDFPEFGGGAQPPPVAAAGVPAAAPVTPAAPAPAPAVSAPDLITRAAPLDIGDCLRRGFASGRANFFPVLGVTLLIGFCAGMAGSIPFVGVLASLFLSGVFYGGLYYYVLQKTRGQPVDLGEAFSGFSVAFLQLALATFVTTLLTLLGFLCLILPGIYLMVCWAFTYVIVREKGLPFWDAMELGRQVVTAQWFRVFGLMLTLSLIVLLLAAVPVGMMIMAGLAAQSGPLNIAVFGLGLLGVVVVSLVLCPFLSCTVAHAYDDLFNPPGPGA